MFKSNLNLLSNRMMKIQFRVKALQILMFNQRLFSKILNRNHPSRFIAIREIHKIFKIYSKISEG